MAGDRTQSDAQLKTITQSEFVQDSSAVVKSAERAPVLVTGTSGAPTLLVSTPTDRRRATLD
jgi:hypothetical protein